MAIKKSTYTSGNGRPHLHAPYVAGVPAEVIVKHVFTQLVEDTDILELCYLPPYCKVLSAELLTVGTSTTTFDVGFMSGAVGSPDPARTSGDELFDGVTPTTMAVASLAKLAAITPTDAPRSIGVKPSADVAASGSTVLYLRLRYATGQ